jgi:hypothetical protein
VLLLVLRDVRECVRLDEDVDGREEVPRRSDADDGRVARRAGDAEQEEIVSRTVSVPNFRKMRALALRDA